jgi:hypothetical protein
MNWDPAAIVRWDSATSRKGTLVTLGTLLRVLRQGVVVASLDLGNVAVETVRVADVQQIIPGAGERRLVSASVLRRHVVEMGDVLMPRVGRHGQACCVAPRTIPVVPREGLFVARPKRREWGAAIAAALCTPTVKQWLGQLPTTGRTTTITKAQLRDIPVPSPAHFDFGQIAARVEQASMLAREGRERLDRVRGEVGLLLDRAPVNELPKDSLWFSVPDVPQGWCWRDVQRHWLRHQAQWQVRGLKQLDDMIDMGSHRPKTVVRNQPAFVLETGAIRSDWLLALPEPPEHVEATLTSKHSASATQRFFALDRECLLIPTVGDIVAPPVVIPEDVFNYAAVPLMVPIHWLPLVGLRYPRALAVVLDHPFVRLQRRLGSAFSTVPHLTREDIATLPIPAASEAQWSVWEQELRRAHSLFSTAISQVKQTISVVEEWYA